MALKRILFVPDTHRPFHDVNAWKLMLRGARAFEPDFVVVEGDFADFYKVSAHDKDPSRRASLQDEIDDVNKGLDELEAVTSKASKRFYVEGNHENRLQRYLWSQSAALADMRSLKVPELFNLHARGWGYTPYKQHLKLGKLYITHEAGNAGFDAHRKAQHAFSSNVVIGHTHRIGYAIVGDARGRAHVGAMFGWLGSAEQADYMHRIQALTQWSHGFGIGFMEESGVIHLQPIPIVKGRCVIGGELIR